MSTRLARLALALYPLAYRRRYGQEMHALLGDVPPGLRGLLDLVRGALAAHLRPAFRYQAACSGRRSRSSLSAAASG